MPYYINIRHGHNGELSVQSTQLHKTYEAAERARLLGSPHADYKTHPVAVDPAPEPARYAAINPMWLVTRADAELAAQQYPTYKVVKVVND